jgi:hypothetical protein
MRHSGRCRVMASWILYLMYPRKAENNRFMIRVGVAFLWLMVLASSALAQGATTPFESPSRPTVGGPGGNPNEIRPTFQASAGTEILRHRSPTGKPCLGVGGYARPHTIAPNVYDHVIEATNGCPQRITIRVCYYQTQNCVPLEIPGGERKQAILGTLPAAKDFRFEFVERF